MNQPDIPVMDVDGKQYALADLTPNQNGLIAQIKDLEKQLVDNEFKHSQLIHGRLAYVLELKQSLAAPTDISIPETKQPLEAVSDGSKSQ